MASSTLMYGQNLESSSNLAAYSATDELPCFKFKNSTSFPVLKSSGKYFLKT